eukprot:scaffold1661_cov251-Pinguiococcus_pyrenoidosus.AAC.12
MEHSDASVAAAITTDKFLGCAFSQISTHHGFGVSCLAASPRLPPLVPLQRGGHEESADRVWRDVGAVDRASFAGQRAGHRRWHDDDHGRAGRPAHVLPVRGVGLRSGCPGRQSVREPRREGQGCLHVDLRAGHHPLLLQRGHYVSHVRRTTCNCRIPASKKAHSARLLVLRRYMDMCLVPRELAVATVAAIGPTP